MIVSLLCGQLNAGFMRYSHKHTHTRIDKTPVLCKVSCGFSGYVVAVRKGCSSFLGFRVTELSV